MSCKYNSDEERFWSKVDIEGGDDCWNWRAAVNTQGYGTFSLKNRTTISHRLSWIFTNGSIPLGKFILHKCDNRLCCNPKHLYLGIHQDNMRDKQFRYKGPYFGGRPRGNGVY